MRETARNAALAARLREAGAVVLQVHGHLGQQPGWPDMYVASHEWTGWIEGKVGGGTCSALQVARMEALTLRGVPALVVRYGEGREGTTWAETPRGEKVGEVRVGGAVAAAETLRDLRVAADLVALRGSLEEET